MHEVPVYVDIYVCMIYIYMYDYMIYLYYIYVCIYIFVCIHIFLLHQIAHPLNLHQIAHPSVSINSGRDSGVVLRPEEQTHSSPPQHSSQLPSPLPPQPLSHLSPQALLQNSQLPAANDTVIKA